MMRSGKTTVLALVAALALVATAAVPALWADDHEGDPTQASTPAALESAAPAASLNAQAWLAAHLGLDPAAVTPIEVKPAQWPDVCLGLAEADEVCAQLLTDGWEAVFQAGGRFYTLRTDSVGAEVRLAGEQAISPLAGTAWRLESYGLGTPVLAGSAPSLAFESDGQVSGHGGCNGFGGRYQTANGSLAFSGLVSTLIACADPALNEQEQAYLAALNAASAYSLADGQLTIAYDGGVLIFAPAGAAPAPAPEGWTRTRLGAEWDVALPPNWAVNAASIEAAAYELEGPWQDHVFQVNLSFPSDVDQDTLDAWVADALAHLTPQHADLAVQSFTVGEVSAAFVRSVPLGTEPSPQHRVYVWSAAGLPPRLITFTQVDDHAYDAQALADFAALFLAQVRNPGADTPATPPPAADAQPARVLGILDFHAESALDFIEAPAAVQAGQSFEVTINTFGGGCDSAGDTEVVLAADGATLTVYDLTTATSADVVCPAILLRLPHVVTLQFDEPGEKLLSVVGRRVGPETPPEGVTITLEHRLIVE